MRRLQKSLEKARIAHELSRLVLIIFVSAISLLMVSCRILGPPALDTRPVALYDPGKTKLHPDYTVYHNGENESTIYFRILCSELLFNQANTENMNMAKVKVDYKLYSSYADQEIAFSNGLEFVIDRDKVKELYTGQVKIPIEKDKSYFLELTLTDLLRDSKKTDFIFVDRFSLNSQQNYLVLSFPGHEIGFGKFYYPDEKFRIISNSSTSGRMQVSYYKPSKILPPPPFMVKEITARTVLPDSIWETDYDQQSLYQMKEKGVYQFFTNREQDQALYLSNFGENFPQVKSPEDMAPPLQYFTTRDEYLKIVQQDDLKKAIDAFWVKTGKDFSNARELIKIFYNRVLFANLYYSTDREGWKTDRGMIYLLMGPPSMVKKTETMEEWNYQSRDNRNYYKFVFTLESDPVKVYDFVLQRTEEHRDVWNAAVQTWRNGRIYSL